MFFSSAVVFAKAREVYEKMKKLVRAEHFDVEKFCTLRSGNSEVYFLGEKYSFAEEEKNCDRFLQRFDACLVFTYRHSIRDLKSEGGEEIASDAGWGCMLRVAQMMLAQALLRSCSATGPGTTATAPRSVRRCLADEVGAPLGIQEFCKIGCEGAFGSRQVGKWFGPTSAALVAAELLNRHHERIKDVLMLSEDREGGTSKIPHGITFDEGPVYEDELRNALEKGPAVMWVCRRLGFEGKRVQYESGLLALFTLPQFLGIGSGNDGVSAHWFVGCYRDKPGAVASLMNTSTASSSGEVDGSSADHDEPYLIYFDPHCAVLEGDTSFTSSDEGGSHSRLAEYAELTRSCCGVLKARYLNTSLCLGFLLTDWADWEEVKGRLSDDSIVPKGLDLIEILKEKPKPWNPEDAGAQLEVLDDEDDDALLL
ncbi:unnamed protein product [Amoebophrya sp. A25]|nr:unnamed protein product [Amoebophrya sp. A25]|eukprot:GSA25T00017043001.1